MPTVMALIESERISMLPGAPTIYQTHAEPPGAATTTCPRCGSRSPARPSIPVSLVEQMRDVLGFDTVVTAYGLTEAGGFATICQHDDPPETIASTSGRAIPGVEVRVVDDAGAEVPPASRARSWCAATT